MPAFFYFICWIFLVEYWTFTLFYAIHKPRAFGIREAPRMNSNALISAYLEWRPLLLRHQRQDWLQSARAR